MVSKERYLQDILDTYAAGELSASSASQMLRLPRAVFYELLAETHTPLPERLNESIRAEMSGLLER